MAEVLSPGLVSWDGEDWDWVLGGGDFLDGRNCKTWQPYRSWFESQPCDPWNPLNPIVHFFFGRTGAVPTLLSAM
jgi:hypothetical protein